jgi:hypothetical protein
MRLALSAASAADGLYERDSTDVCGGLDDARIRAAWTEGQRQDRGVPGAMTRSERNKLGVTVVAVALVMALVGTLLAAIGGPLTLVGVALLTFGIAGVCQGVAIAAGLLTLRAEDSEDRDASGD